MWYWFLDLALVVCLILFMVDGLTHLWVRRCYDLFYHLMVRTGGHLIFIDIDNLRKFNNQYGHLMGDVVLRRVGIIILIESRCRGFRYGGDELAVLLPWSNKEKALELAERIRQRIERIDIEGLKVTVTCAVARYEQTASNLLKQGKGGGKNQVIVE